MEPSDVEMSSSPALANAFLPIAISILNINQTKIVSYICDEMPNPDLHSLSNTFSGGIDKDSSPELVPSTKYLDGQNGRLTSTTGDRLKFQNIKGDELYCILPDIPAIARKQLCFIGCVHTVTLDITVVHDGITYTFHGIFNVEAGGVSGVLTGLESANFNPPHTDTNLTAFLVFFQECSCITIKVIDPADTLSVVIDSFICCDPEVPTCNVTVTDTSIPAQHPTLIFNSTWGDTDWVFITKSVDAAEPFTDRGYGQIWKVDIQGDGFLDSTQVDLTKTLLIPATLKYNDLLTLDVHHRPEMKYIIENDCIKRLYWTDNFNRPRELNLGLAGLINLDVGLLAWQPEFILSDIVFTQYGGGQLKGGVYQYAYRLITADGKTTFWSPLTRHVNVVRNNSDPYQNYVGDHVGINTTQSVKLNIPNVDTRYAKIQIAYAFFIAQNGAPAEVGLVTEQGITGSSMSFEHVSNFQGATFGDVTAADLGIQNPAFFTVKTIETYRQRMFAANFCEDNFFFDTAGIVLDYGVAEIYSDQFRGCFPDGQPEIGQANRTTGSWYDSPVAGFNAPPTRNFNIINDWLDYKGGKIEHEVRGYWGDEVYRFGIVFFLKNGKFTDAFWINADSTGGTRRDFQFPNRGCSQDTDNPTIELITAVNAGITPPDNQYVLRPLYLKATNINLNQVITDGVYAGQMVKDVVTGFSIVRAHRDKRITAQGVIINSAQGYTKPLPLTICDGDPGSLSGLMPYVDNTFVPAFTGTKDNGGWFYSPESDILPGAGAVTAGEKAVKLGFFSAPAGYTRHIRCSGDIVKLYQMNTAPCVSSDILKAQLIDTDTSVGTFIPADGEYSLRIPQILVKTCDGSCRNDVSKVFGRAELLQLSGSINFAEFNFATQRELDVINIYEPKDKATLYGGFSDSAISATQYIGTGHFQPVSCDVGVDGVYSAIVWGGDCLVQYYTRVVEYMVGKDPGNRQDYCDPPGTINVCEPCPDPVDPPCKCGLQDHAISTACVISFPVESEVNGTLRYAASPEYLSQNTIWSTTLPYPGMVFDLGSGTKESFSYADAYSYEEQIQFFPSFDYTKDRTCLKCSPTTIAASNKKINGETIDSYLQFPVNNRAEVDQRFGSITHIRRHPKFDEGLYGWQSFAFFVYPIEQAQILNNNTNQITGSGEIFAPFPYYKSDEFGCRQQASICQSHTAFYWYCDVRKALCRFGQDGEYTLSDNNGLARLFLTGLQFEKIMFTDTPLAAVGVSSSYDHQYKECLFTFLAPDLDPQVYPLGYSDQIRPTQYFTLIWNEETNCFTHFFTPTPYLWMPISGNRLLSQRVPIIQPQHIDEDYKVFWHYKNTNGYGLFYLTPPNYPPLAPADPNNPNDPADPFNVYWDIHRTFLEYIGNGSNKETKEASCLLLDANRMWWSFRVRSSPVLNYSNQQMILETQTQFEWAYWRPRGAKQEISIPDVKNVLGVDNNNLPIPLLPNDPRLSYCMSRLRGEQIYVQFTWKGVDYREILESLLNYHPSRVNL